MDTLARAPGGQMRGAATKSMSDIVEERQQSRYAPWPPRPVGLRPAGPLALLLAPHIPPRVLLVARASPAGLGACSKVSILFLDRPLSLRGPVTTSGFSCYERISRRKCRGI